MVSQRKKGVWPNEHAAAANGKQLQIQFELYRNSSCLRGGCQFDSCGLQLRCKSWHTFLKAAFCTQVLGGFIRDCEGLHLGTCYTVARLMLAPAAWEFERPSFLG